MSRGITFDFNTFSNKLIMTTRVGVDTHESLQPKLPPPNFHYRNNQATEIRLQSITVNQSIVMHAKWITNLTIYVYMGVLSRGIYT